MKEMFDQLDHWVLELLRGMDGFTLLLVILLFAALMVAARPDASRRDSKRRNQAHKVR